MKNMNITDKYTDREWEEIASLLSDEKNDNQDLLNRFMAEDRLKTALLWKKLKEMKTDEKIDVDKAWNKLCSRLQENGLNAESRVVHQAFFRTAYFRIAALVILLLGIGSLVLNLYNNGTLSRKTVVVTQENQKNLQVTLPDGSNIFLNRNTRLSYRNNFGRFGRNVSLKGEAFFEITGNGEDPFVVDAGKASVKVMGTSFNIITNNQDYAVEVFVKTGQVMLTDNAYENTLILEPGYIGTMDSGSSNRKLNNDPNYMAWNTGYLQYDGQTLDVVFRDLKRVYNMDIVADNPGILENKWTSPIDNLQQETIIRLICVSFNLDYTKDGNIYHLEEK
jgi:ferric-dicitrate binding protein FerR (iron transport regulator)